MILIVKFINHFNIINIISTYLKKKLKLKITFRFNGIKTNRFTVFPSNQNDIKFISIIVRCLQFFRFRSIKFDVNYLTQYIINYSLLIGFHLKKTITLHTTLIKIYPYQSHISYRINQKIFFINVTSFQLFSYLSLKLLSRSKISSFTFIATN